MDSFLLKNIEAYSATWLPFGRSNMEALNRFVGSHKKYTSATEFGIKGSIKDMGEGAIAMKEHGVFLTPIEYDFTGFLKAVLREESNTSKEFGVYLSKFGLATLGIDIEEKEALTTDEVKIICGKLNYKFSSCVMPLLTDVQQGLVNSLYEVSRSADIGYKLHSYSLVKCTIDEASDMGNSDQFLENFGAEVASITDWVMDHTTIDGCHIFVGMAACLCVGATTPQVEAYLQNLMYVHSCHKTAQRLHSLLWSIRRQIQNYRKEISSGSYKILKKTNDQICVTNDLLSKISVFDQMLRDETRLLFDDVEEKFSSGSLGVHLIKDYEHEIEKSENRDVTIQQLMEEVNVLSSELENRLELIMTKDNMQLNLILLVLTVISILGVAEIIGFSKEQWGVVGVFLGPFGVFILFYLRKFLKNYQLRESELGNK